MKGFLFASFLIVAVSSSLLEQDGAKFQAFKLEHGKTYKNQAEEAKRFAIFRDNLRSIELHNARFEQGLETYTQGINKFADMTPAEFKAMLGLHINNKLIFTKRNMLNLPVGDSVPDSIDWREKNAVVPIKNQGKCGASYAFALVGSVESAYAIKTGNLTELSKQQIIDCTITLNLGCNGGLLEQTYPYIVESGLLSEADYPYADADGTCQYNSSKVVTKISAYVSFSDNEDTLKEVVGTVGPVVAGIDADTIRYYKSGIYNDTSCPQTSDSLDHAVLVVGYGAENGTDYWIVKNTWGETWGESGYIRLARGVNQCGIAAENSYPVI